MDKFQVYNRNGINSAWDTSFELVSGWKENWVLDKTTDSAIIKAKYTGANPPSYKKGDWVRLVHGDTATNKPIITSKKMTKLNSSFVDVNVTYDDEHLLTQVSFSNDIPTVFTVVVQHNNGSLKQTFENVVANTDYVFQVGARLVGTIVAYIEEEYVYCYDMGGYVLPDNYEQFIIGSSTYVQNVVTGEWDCQFTLKEPIEVLNGIMCETVGFTNQYEKKYGDYTYFHDTYNCCNALERILKITPANNDLDKSWFSRIAIFDIDLLKSISFNDGVLSEPTLYSILMDKYDSLVGMTPVLYFDINSDGSPINTSKPTYFLMFERQDGFDKEEVELDDLLENRTAYIQNNSEENFADGLISNFDNLSVDNGIHYISEEIWALPEIDTPERDVTSYDVSTDKMGEWILNLQHKIKSVDKIERYTLHQETNVYNWTKKVENIDKIYEKQQYEASLDFKNTNERSKVAWYELGDNKIHLNDYYYREISYTNTDTYLYRVHYTPLISARYDLGKDYQVQINQNDSQIDADKFGEYLKEYLASMNKSDIIIQKTINDFNDIIEIGTKVVDGDKNYIITNVSIQNRGFDYDVIYQLNENHIRKSDNIEASQEIRKNIAIDTNSFKERKTMLSNDYKISLFDFTTPHDMYDPNGVKVLSRCIFSSLLNNGVEQTKHPNLAVIETKTTHYYNGTYYDNMHMTFTKQLFSELGRFILNNTICFNMVYKDNAMAGTQKNVQSVTASITDSSQNLGTGEFYGTINSQIPLIYTDPFGEVSQLDIKLQNVTTLKIEDVDVNNFTTKQDVDNLNAIEQVVYSIASQYPDASGLTENTSIFEKNDINYYKDMVEQLNITLGLHCNCDNNMIICKGLLKNSILMTSNPSNISYAKVYSKNVNEKDLGVEIAINTINVSNATFKSETRIGGASGYLFQITLASSVTNPKAIAFFNTNDEPLLIINDLDTNNTATTQIKIRC